MSSSEVAAVAKAVDAIRKAMIGAKKDELEGVALSSLSYGHSGGHIEDRAEFARAIVAGESCFLTLEFNDQTIEVDGNTAIVRNIFEGDTNDNGVPGRAHIGVMIVMKKDDKGEWKMYARQAYKLNAE